MLVSISLGVLNERERKMLETSREYTVSRSTCWTTGRTVRSAGFLTSPSRTSVQLVRGKAGAKIEFGAKLVVAVENGHAFVDHSPWENFNKSTLFVEGCEQYRERKGSWP